MQLFKVNIIKLNMRNFDRNIRIPSLLNLCGVYRFFSGLLEWKWSGIVMAEEDVFSAHEFWSTVSLAC